MNARPAVLTFCLAGVAAAGPGVAAAQAACLPLEAPPAGPRAGSPFVTAHAGPVRPFPDAGAVPPRRDRRAAPDPWLGEDKGRHMVASFALTAFAFGGANAVGVDWPDAGAAAGALAFGAGIAKEMSDRARGGPFSARDVAWNALGIGAALLLASRAR